MMARLTRFLRQHLQRAMNFKDAHPANKWVGAHGQSSALESSCLQRPMVAVRLDLQRASGHLEDVEGMAGVRNTSVGRAVRLASLRTSGCNITGGTEEQLFERANAKAVVRDASVHSAVAIDDGVRLALYVRAHCCSRRVE